MHISELDFTYPEELVATHPSSSYRTLLSQGGDFSELTPADVLGVFNSGDVLVVNDTRVLKRRVFSKNDLEVLFLQQLSGDQWEVLFPARNTKVGGVIELPNGVQMKLIKKGLPQTVELSTPVTEDYFKQVGELALPPYIQKSRNERHNQPTDDSWYQTAWATEEGSFAAPTASLHFTAEVIKELKDRGVRVVNLTLHVGLGTFLPIKSENLVDHKMHSEWCHIPHTTLKEINEAKKTGHRVFALGTTVTRSLESWAAGLLEPTDSGGVVGDTDIFITPGFDFKCIDVLMTNFHQPKSTLLALVGAFAGMQTVKKAYSWAIDRNFKLFSYGDFSIWIRN